VAMQRLLWGDEAPVFSAGTA